MKNKRERSVFAAVVGVPNVGKSTLLNRLVGVKIAITSPRPQTTRNRIMGVMTDGDVQYVFLDTPGFHLPRTRLGEHMVKAVRDSIADIDCALFVTWPKEQFSEDEDKLLQELTASRTPVILVINKADTMKSWSDAERITQSLMSAYPFKASALTCALDGTGGEELLRLLESFSTEGPHMYPEDTLTDVPERDIAAELVREQLLLHLRDELPHGCAVSVERWIEREDGLVDIDAEILCEKSSHKGMIIGKGGQMLKQIGTQARMTIEDFLGCHVNLKLWVKVREDWRNRESTIKSLGL